MKKYSLFLLTLILFSCKKDEPQPTTTSETIKWQRYKDLPAFSSAVHNILGTDSNLIISGPLKTFVVSKQNFLKQNSITFNYENGISYTFRTPLTKSYFGLFSGYDFISIHKFIENKFQLYEGSTFDYKNLKNYDLNKIPFYQTLRYFSNLNGNPIGLNNQTICLPFRGKNSDSVWVQLLDLKDPINSNYKLTPLNLSMDEVYFLNVFSAENYHLVMTYLSVFKVDNSGNLNKVLSSKDFKAGFFVSSFKFNSKLYVVTQNYLLSSSDDGATWQKEYSVNSEFSWAYYQSVGNRLFGYYNDQLYEIKFNSDGSITSTRLNYTGLEGNYITCLTLFQGKLFAGTLSGLYYIDFSKI
jgi:hypothetical protein